ncbi:MAG: hypothetical protein GY750_14620 [Lentisphaerae bacterium]|nr:hypothetical protein [Lentisphaerota bacterium]MCP4102635.1 hypothetical protein [Lentisphaerota bacterium]
MGHEIRRRIPEVLPSHATIDFFEIRISAETRARRCTNNEDVTLDEIYFHIREQYPAIPYENIEKVKQLEIEIEIANVIGIKKNIDRIHELLRNGEKVILISDMYLPRSVIKQMLSKVDSLIATLPFYLSCELMKTKHIGSLYEHVLEQEGIRPQELCHTGDNHHADIKVAKRKSIKTCYYNKSALSEIEQSYLLDEANVFLQLVAGASKLARLSATYTTPQYILGACLTAPLFYGFVKYCITESEKNGIKNIYYLSRDGLIFKLINDAIFEVNNNQSIKARYLFGSRQAFNLPSIFELTDRHRRWLASKLPLVSLESLLSRVGVDIDMFLALVPKEQIQGIPLNRILSPLQHKRVVDLIYSVSDLKQVIYDNAKQSRQLLIKYLKQESFFEHEKSSYIDVGWSGNVQDSFYSIISEEQANYELTGFYYGSFGVTSRTSAKNKKIAYSIKSDHEYTNMVAVYLEALAQADHGSVCGYKENKQDAIEAVVEDFDNGCFNFDSYFAGIKAFSKYLSELLNEYDFIHENFEIIEQRLTLRLFHPTKEIANAIGPLRYSGDQNHTNKKEIAPAFSILDALKYQFTLMPRKNYDMTKWLEVTKLRSNVFVKSILAVDNIPNTLKKIAHNFTIKKYRRHSLKGKCKKIIKYIVKRYRNA